MIEKECLAASWAIENLWYYILGNELALITDHAPLCWLTMMKDKAEDHEMVPVTTTILL